MDVSGRRHPAHRGPRGALSRRRPRRSRARPVRSGRSPRHGAAPRRRSAAPSRARLPDPARPHDRLPRQRRRLQPLLARGGPQPDAPRAALGPLRRRAPARAGRAPAVLGRLRLRARPARRHLPRVLHEPGHEQRREPARRAAPVQPPARPHRGLRGGGVDGAALLRRALPDRPQRRRRARAARPARDPATACGSRSSARPSSARACRCCCAPSRRCASTSPSS